MAFLLHFTPWVGNSWTLSVRIPGNDSLLHIYYCVVSLPGFWREVWLDIFIIINVIMLP